MTLPGVSVRPSVKIWKKTISATRAKIMPNWRVLPPKSFLSAFMLSVLVVRNVLDGPESGSLAGGGHQLHEAFLAGFLFSEYAGDGAFEDGVDTVREAQQFRQFRGNDDDALTL